VRIKLLAAVACTATSRAASGFFSRKAADREIEGDLFDLRRALVTAGGGVVSGFAGAVAAATCAASTSAAGGGSLGVLGGLRAGGGASRGRLAVIPRQRSAASGLSSGIPALTSWETRPLVSSACLAYSVCVMAV